MTKVAAIQMGSCSAVGPNLVTVGQLLEQAANKGAKLAVLPENFAFMGAKPEDVLVVKETYGSGRIQDFIAKMASELGLWVIAGTIPLACEHEDKVIPASIVWNDQGEVVARYDKIHLYDVYIAESSEAYRESDTYHPGSEPCVVDTPAGKVGLSICYDVRFPELYRRLREMGVDIFTVPAAFAAATGAVHWRTLLRTRAIENQCYVIAPGQCGLHDNGRMTHGHSIVVDPWGDVLGCQETGIGAVVADVDLVRLQVLREDFPVWEHRRLC